MTSRAILNGWTLAPGRPLGFTPTPTPTPTPITATLSDPTIYNIASIGMRYPNKQGTIGAGFLYYASQTMWISPPWLVPSGSEYLVHYPNVYNIEQNQGTNPDGSGGNEGLIPQNVTITSSSVTYLDANGTSRTAYATGAKLDGSGVLSSTAKNGGVIASHTLPADIPANAVLTIRVAITLPDGATLISFYDPKTGEEGRKSTTTSFDTLVVAGSAILGNSGSAVASINGFMYGPQAAFAKGADGRPTVYNDGDSINYGAGGLDFVSDITRSRGIVEFAFARTANGYRVPEFSAACSASGFSYRDPNDVNYSPTINDSRFATVAKIAALNGGKLPFTDILSEHGTNSIQNTVDFQVTKTKASHVFLRAHLGNLPITQTTMVPKSVSSDNYQTLPNQAPNGDAPTRFGFNDKLLADLVDGSAQYAINTYAPISGAAIDPDRRKFAVVPFVAQLTTALAANGQTITINQPVTPGMSLIVGGQNRIARTVTNNNDGTYTVITDVGSSSANYPAAASGQPVYSAYNSDGDPTATGLHITAIANATIAASQRADGYDAWKRKRRADVGGTWFTLDGITAPAAPTLTLTPGVEKVDGSFVPGANGGSAITQHNVYRKQGSGAEVLAFALPVGTTTFTDTGLLAFQCTYRVASVNAAGEGTAATQNATPTAGAAFTDFAVDTFTAASGTQNIGRTTDTGAQTWGALEASAAPAMLVGTDNRIYGSATTNSNALLNNAPNADFDVAADVVRLTSVTGILGGVVGGSTGSTTYYGFYYRQGSGGFILTKVVSSTQTIIATYIDAFASGTRRTRLVRIGTKLTALLDGVPVATINDTTISGAGRVGIKSTGAASSDATGLKFDNFAASSRP